MWHQNICYNFIFQNLLWYFFDFSDIAGIQEELVEFSLNKTDSCRNEEQ